MQSDTLNKPNSKNLENCHKKCSPDLKKHQSQEHIGSPPKLQRKKSWSDEVEDTLEEDTDEKAIQDKLQWCKQRRTPHHWTDDVNVQVSGNKSSPSQQRLQSSPPKDTTDDVNAKVSCHKPSPSLQWLQAHL